MAQQYSDYDRIGDLELLVLDSTSLDVKQRLHLPERMNDDAIQITGLALDTARWKVTPDQTAFGLRVTRTGSSRKSFSEDALSLFVIENNQLRAVLNGIVLENSTGEWDGTVGTFHDIKRTLALAPDSHNGYFDIRVNEKTWNQRPIQTPTSSVHQRINRGKPVGYCVMMANSMPSQRTVPVVLRGKAGDSITISCSSATLVFSVLFSPVAGKSIPVQPAQMASRYSA